MNAMNILLVGVGGFAGSALRYVAVHSVDKKLNALFPYGTLFVNLAGSFIIGILVGCFAGKSGAADQWRLLLGTGFCGGFTTFSAFAMENVNLLEQKLGTAVILYVLTSVAGGLLAAWAGLAISRTLF